jgi:energy-coupling factor transporter ATP-binding protein EcfA2
MTLGPILGTRVVIVGNSGSGKSTLAKVLAQRLAAPAIDLDPIRWQDRVGNERDEKLAADMIVEAAAKPSWIIEGVCGGSAAVRGKPDQELRSIGIVRHGQIKQTAFLAGTEARRGFVTSMGAAVSAGAYLICHACKLMLETGIHMV